MSDRLVYLGPNLPGIPESLMLARDRGEVLFLTGAGVSMPPPSNLPNFQGLVIDIYAELDTRLAQAMGKWVEAEKGRMDADSKTPTAWSDYADGLDPRQKTELKRFAGAEYDVVLGMLERRMARTGPENRLRAVAAEVLKVDRAPNGLHRALNVLGRRYGDLFIATTNFDPLHERAAGRGARPQRHAPGSMPGPAGDRTSPGCSTFTG